MGLSIFWVVRKQITFHIVHFVFIVRKKSHITKFALFKWILKFSIIFFFNHVTYLVIYYFFLSWPLIIDNFFTLIGFIFLLIIITTKPFVLWVFFDLFLFNLLLLFNRIFLHFYWFLYRLFFIFYWLLNILNKVIKILFTKTW